jgi:hypothetical protein
MKRFAVRQEFFDQEERTHLPDLLPMCQPINAEAATAMRTHLKEVLPMACDLSDSYWESSLPIHDRIGTWCDDAPAHYIAAVDECRPNYDGDLIRVMDSNGNIVDRSPLGNFRIT